MRSHLGFDPENARQALPFAIAGIAGVGCAALLPNSSPVYLVFAAALVGFTFLLTFFCDWARPPARLAIVPPLLFLGVLALLLQANGESGWGFMALIVLPVIWVALNGRRWQLVVLLVAVAALYGGCIASGIGEQSAGRWGFAVLWVVVATLLGFTIRNLVGRERAQAAQLGRQNSFLDALFDQAGSLVAVLELDGRLARVNPACAELSGFAAAELLGRPFWEALMDRKVGTGVAAYWAATAPAELAGVTEIPMRTQDGQLHRIHWTVAPLTDDDGRLVNFVATGLDVTVEREAKAALADSEYRFRTLVSHLPDTMLGLYDRDLRCLALDGDVEAHGLDRASFEGQLLSDVLPAENMAKLRPPLEAALRGESTTFEYSSHLNEAHYEIEVVPFVKDGEIRGAYMVSRDISRRRTAEAEVRAAEDRFAASFEHAPVGMEMIDLDGRFIGVNPALGEIVGFAPEELMGLHTSAITIPTDAARDERLRASILAGEVDRYDVEKRMIHADGREIDVAVHLSIVRSADGEARYFVGQVLDITAAKEFERDLRHMADHDFLTGLMNRRRFEEEIAGHLTHGSRHGDAGALLMLDIDKFKTVNDTLGHAAGDAAIVGLARLLARGLRTTDKVARLGGDEFAVLLPGADGDHAAAVAGKLAAAIAGWDFGTAFADLALTASIGVLVIDDRVHRVPADALIDVDRAMYVAKRAGGDGFASTPAAPAVPPPSSVEGPPASAGAPPAAAKAKSTEVIVAPVEL
jgi:diguanylate cyclase (GGDEF)-like protein/PAS domain S-box-containing protein